MDYEKKYNDLVARLNKAKNDEDVCDDRFCVVIDEILLESKESEDEVIRKHIINILDSLAPCHWDGNEKANCIDYLEKQKDASKAIEAVERIDKYIDEHLANAHDMKDSNPDKKYYRGWDDALGEISRILQDIYSGEKQKEQKPTKTLCIPKFRKSDMVVSTNNPRLTYRILDVGNINELGNPEYKVEIFTDGKSDEPRNIKYIEVAKMDDWGKLIEQKPAEWSERDIKILNELITIMNGGTVTSGTYLSEYVAWFKSLPERFNLQLTKQEWSEEDEKMLNVIIGNYRDNDLPAFESDRKDVIDWLKFRLQYRWKPSEEQMKALDDIIPKSGQPCTLQSLYHELQKL